jgi:hypothetical protein
VTRSTIAGTLLVLAVVSPLVAQVEAPLKPGSPIRLNLHCDAKAPSVICARITGTFASLSTDTVWMTGNGRPSAEAFPRNRIVSVERQVPSNARGRSALIGLGIGAAAGIGFSFLFWHECGGCEGSNPASFAAGSGAVFGLVGAGIGALVGGGSRWQLVPLDGQGVGLAWRH